MKKLSLGGGPPLSAPVEVRLDWAYRALRTIEQGSQENDVSDLGQNFSFDAAVTPVTTLLVATPSLANTNAVLATLLTYLQKGGPNRAA